MHNWINSCQTTIFKSKAGGACCLYLLFNFLLYWFIDGNLSNVSCWQKTAMLTKPFCKTAIIIEIARRQSSIKPLLCIVKDKDWTSKGLENRPEYDPTLSDYTRYFEQMDEYHQRYSEHYDHFNKMQREIDDDHAEIKKLAEVTNFQMQNLKAYSRINRKFNVATIAADLFFPVLFAITAISLTGYKASMYLSEHSIDLILNQISK